MDVREFKKFRFVSITSPETWTVVILLLLSGLLVGTIADTLLEGRLIINPWLFALGFVSLNLLSGLFMDKAIPSFKAKWSYLVVFLSQITFIMVTALFVISSRITLFDSLVLWSTLSYTLWMIMLSGLGSVKVGSRMMSLASVQPALIWILVLFSVELAAVNLFVPLMLMLGGVAVAILVLLFTEHVFSLVFTGLSGMAELSKFLKGIRGEQVSLGIGHNIDALLQYMKFKVGRKESIIVAPWLHSGPLRGVGGGNLSTQCIEKLNKEFSDSYFLHVPSNHEYNPSTKVASRILKAIGKPHYSELKVSRVMESSKSGITARGQRFNSLYLVSLSGQEIDDYDASIFASLREKYSDRDVLFIDSHPNLPMKQCINVENFSPESAIVESLIEELMEKLSKESVSPAQVGTSFKVFDQYSVFAMLVKAKETVLYFVSDTNGHSPAEMRTIEKVAVESGIDRVMFFTTDTHALSVKALINRQDLPISLVRESISEAMAKMKKASFAYGESLIKNVRILGKTYYELVTLVRIMSRVVPILYVLLFAFLTLLLWMF
jgi:predicted neutral ceramidase superfamily lipid hydrolase